MNHPTHENFTRTFSFSFNLNSTNELKEQTCTAEWAEKIGQFIELLTQHNLFSHLKDLLRDFRNFDK